MKKIVLIGKAFNSEKTNGPAAVLHELDKAFKKSNIDYMSIFLNENISKIKFMYLVLKEVLLKEDLIINVHTSGFLIPLYILIISVINKKNKYYLTIHGIYRIESSIYGNQNKIYCILEKIIYKNFPNLICVSEMLKENIINLYNRKNNIYVIGNGTSAVEYKLNQKNFNKNLEKNTIKFVMVGGINQRKGIFEAISFIEFLIKKTEKTISMDIYGRVESDNVKKAFDSMIEEKNLTNVIRYKGLIRDKEELYKIYSDSNFNLCLSKYDTFNVAIIESMIMECPCISSNKCGAIDYIIDGVNGLIIDMDENYCEEISNKLSIITSNYSDACFKAFDIYKKVSWSVIQKLYIDLFKGEKQ